MSKALFYEIPKIKKAKEIVRNLKQQGINAEICKKGATH